MSEPKSGQMIQAPSALRLKVGGGRLGAIDPAAIAKAEAALKSLSGNFTQWLNDEITKLEGARQTVRTEGANPENMESLYLRAHDLKGLGATYGFPLITRIAGLLCRLIDDKAKRLQAPVALIDAHIDAIKAAARDDIKTEEHPVGKILVQELESRISAFGA
ncbi:MAG: histidine phosphotransferase [Phenylobacterium sp. RIFCSPHIGHO2_01_FULL_69_31]|uniref:Hpt domain-containing protein n=1 Tax=Phenylobacterium sp. RIFCSPHIGHO2_01_FULL_69_31 TaxID=1801944 RepID=UPI0008B17F23|nr:Hpt domain-containing protein [Phenylobacterium sp. RIFCSPHIGHO2_01_FULL_69_31]OHB31406.1 MAG: histidine phosphotransferase [Phenylobacterium sp. RIFCSPHIGHO2_01_FULL_69_31]